MKWQFNALDMTINFVTMIEQLLSCRAGATLDYGLLRPLSGDLVPLLEALTNLPANWKTPSIFVLCDTCDKVSILFRKYTEFVNQVKPFSRNVYFT